MPTERTPEGKWVLYDVEGQRHERWPIDARNMLAQGEFTTDPPTPGDPAPAVPVAPAPEVSPALLVVDATTGVVTGEHPTGAPVVVAPAETVTGARPVQIPTARKSKKS